MISFCTPMMPVKINTELEGYFLLFEVIANDGEEKFYIYDNNITKLELNIKKLLNSYVTEDNKACSVKLILVTYYESLILNNFDAFIM